ncbi:formate/nitrite transporter family protein [Roseateles sp. BYS180W]|uniref:Formate/nitrite transporter family protein n=1 Tax=Roseateles rivi TaxID=3299028 RepID=A0ABW7FRR9_9BURK
MTTRQTIDYFAKVAVGKQALLRQSPWAFGVSSMLGGAYVGLGIALILSIGAQLPAEWRRLCMGASFAVALVLVVLAGAELFTGHTLYMPLGWLRRQVKASDVLRGWLACWLGNLLGSFLVASLFALGGANGLLEDPHSLLYRLAEHKLYDPPLALVARAILCNWLVCLALWMCARVDSDAARCTVIFWCLLAFIGSGYEHSVANMTVMSLVLIGKQFDPATLAAALSSLAWVTLGNTLGGALMVGGAYGLAQQPKNPPHSTAAVATDEGVSA